MAAPFSRRDDGSIDVRFTRHEAELVRRLATDLPALLETPDASMQRLFPPAYPDDVASQAAFSEMTHDDLTRSKIERAERVLESLDAGEDKRTRWNGTLNDERAHDWLGLFNDVRLILGSQLDITEETDHRPLPPSDPRAPAFNTYLYLGAMQESLLDELLGGIVEPPGTDVG